MTTPDPQDDPQDDPLVEPLVDIEALRDYMGGVSLKGYQESAAEDVIAGVIAEIASYLNRPVVVRERTERVVAGRGGAWLSATPVLSVASVDDAPYAEWDQYLSAIPSGRLHRARWGENIVVYTGGLAADREARDLLRIEVLRAAADEMTNRHDDTASVKDLTIRKSDNRSPKRSESPAPEQRARFARLERYKRRSVR